MRLIGYTPTSFTQDCEAFANKQLAQKQAVVLLGPGMRHVERTLIPVRDRDEAITGWLLVFRDMTEEMDLVRLKDDMTDMLVHDLRSPLTAVMGSLSLMKRVFDEHDAEGFEQLRGMAEQSSDRILQMVNQLLDISRLESGQLPLQRETLKVDELFKDAGDRFVSLSEDAQVDLSIDVSPDLPSLCVDVPLIYRVMDNLLDNAIKFTPDGGHVRLWAICEARSEADEMLIGVSDTGPGISAEAQSRLFTKFQQVASVQGRRSGTGLGLAFCKLAVEAHGGRIWVESEAGHGSTFAFALPVVAEPAQP